MTTGSVASLASVGLTWQRLAPTLAQTPCLALAQVHSEQYTPVWVDEVKIYGIRQVEQAVFASRPSKHLLSEGLVLLQTTFLKVPWNTSCSCLDTKS